jgi:uncharacterized protein YggE
MTRIRELLALAALVALLMACTSASAAAGSVRREAGPSTVVQEPSYWTEAPGALRSITVIGKGKVRLVPDIARIHVGAEARAGTVSEAKAEVDHQMVAMVAALQGMGVDEQDIRTSYYGIHHVSELAPPLPKGPPAESEDGYQVLNMFQVTVRNVEKAGDVLDAAVEAGANQVQGVTFTISDEETWLSQAREKAMEDAMARAAELADLAGVQLGEVLSVSEVIPGFPVPMAAVIESSISGGIAPGELEMVTQVQVSFAIQ